MKVLFIRWAFITSVVITFFLFYIDEGYYNFKWMKDPGNWMALVIYVMLIWGIILLFGFSITRLFKWMKRLV